MKSAIDITRIADRRNMCEALMNAWVQACIDDGAVRAHWWNGGAWGSGVSVASDLVRRLIAKGYDAVEMNDSRSGKARNGDYVVITRPGDRTEARKVFLARRKLFLEQRKRTEYARRRARQEAADLISTFADLTAPILVKLASGSEGAEYAYVVAYRDHHPGNSKGEYAEGANAHHIHITHYNMWDRGIHTIYGTDADVPALIALRRRAIKVLQSRLISRDTYALVQSEMNRCVPFSSTLHPSFLRPEVA